MGQEHKHPLYEEIEDAGFGARLRAGRKALGLKPEAFTELVRTKTEEFFYDHKAIVSWETGKSRPTIWHAILIMRTLGVSWGWLMGRTESGGPAEGISRDFEIKEFEKVYWAMDGHVSRNHGVELMEEAEKGDHRLSYKTADGVWVLENRWREVGRVRLDARGRRKEVVWGGYVEPDKDDADDEAEQEGPKVWKGPVARAPEAQKLTKKQVRELEKKHAVMKPADLHRAATHEASHAVVAYAVGHRVLSARVYPSGGGRMGSVSIGSSAASKATVDIAGYLGDVELGLKGRKDSRNGCAKDFKHLERACGWSRTIVNMVSAGRTARRILRTEWPAVLAVASALTKRKRLSEVELVSILADYQVGI